MEAKELRIGNLVEWNGEIAIVSQLLEKDVFFKCGETDLYDAIKPITLKKEWLLKFSFKKRKVQVGHNWTQNITIKEWQDDFFLYFIDSIQVKHIDIKYVHQLQNLYFALTNYELIIKTK